MDVKKLRELIDCLSILYELLVGEGQWERATIALKNVWGFVDDSCFSTALLNDTDSIKCSRKKENNDCIISHQLE